MQHNMSSTSFRSKMALGSWVKTPLYPGINAAAGIIKKAMGKGKKSGSGDFPGVESGSDSSRDLISEYESDA